MMPEIQFWTDLPCNSGARIAVVPRLVSLKGSYSLDNNDSLTIEVPWDDSYLTSIKLRDVVQFTNRLGSVIEHRIKSIDDGRAPGGGATVTITTDPIIKDLAAELIFDPHTGWRRDYALGVENLTSNQYISTYILLRPTLSYFAIGTIDFTTERYDIAWDFWSKLQLLQELANRSAGEITARRNGTTNYLLDHVIARNSSLSTVLLRTDRNITKIDRSRRVEPLRTVIVPHGKIPEGDTQASGLGYAAWKITAIASNTLTIADPNMGPDPIAFDDQLNSLYVLKPDATLTQISDTRVGPQEIDVASAAGLAVDDHIEIRADSDGTLLSELTNPSSITDFGRVVGPASDGDARGERNHVPNPFMTAWTITEGDDGDVIRALLDGNHASTTTMNLKNVVPDDAVIAVNALIYRTISSIGIRVTTGGTASGGNVSLTTTSFSGNDNDEVIIWRLPPMPTGWTRTVTSSEQQPYMPVDPTNQAVLTGLINGSTSNSRQVVMDGITANAEVEAGSVLRTGSTVIGVIAGRAQADGSGNLTVQLLLIKSVTDNDSISITPAEQANDVGTNAFFTPAHIQNSGPAWDSAPYEIRFVTGMAPLWCSVGFSLYSPIFFGAMNAASGDVLACALQVINADTSAVIATLNDDDRTLVAGDVFHQTLRQRIELSATTNIKLRFFSPRLTITPNFPPQDPYVMLRWAMIHIGSDPRVLPIEGSHANRLWHMANDRLLDLSYEPLSITVNTADLAHLNPDLASETLDVGRSVRVMCNDMAGGGSLDRTTRITNVERDELDPTKGSLLKLETIPPRLTKALERAKLKQLYGQVNVNPDENDIPIMRTFKTTEFAPVAVPGAPRSVVPQGQSGSDDGTGEIPPEPYEFGEVV